VAAGNIPNATRQASAIHKEFKNPGTRLQQTHRPRNRLVFRNSVAHLPQHVSLFSLDSSPQPGRLKHPTGEEWDVQLQRQGSSLFPLVSWLSRSTPGSLDTSFTRQHASGVLTPLIFCRCCSTGNSRALRPMWRYWLYRTHCLRPWIRVHNLQVCTSSPVLLQGI
jgi:hypothetical protein